MIRVAICDDDQVSLEVAHMMLDKLMSQTTQEAYQVSCFNEALSMINAIEKYGSFDLLLCDILMPGLNGTEAIKELRDLRDNCHVVFLTATAQFAIDAFDLQAEGYVLKPYNYDKFKQVVGPVVQTIANQVGGFLNLKTYSVVRRVVYSNILYTEASGHNQIIHLADGTKEHMRSSGAALYAQISNDSRFYKMGASFIVNLDAVVRYDGTDVTMINGDVLKVPERQRKPFMTAYQKHFNL